MPQWSVQQDRRQDLPTPPERGLGFETALAGDYALERSMPSETSAIQVQQAGAIFESEQGEYIHIDGVQALSPSDGVSSVRVDVVDMAAGGQSLQVVNLPDRGFGQQTILVIAQAPPSETESGLDQSNRDDQAQDAEVAASLDLGQASAEGGEVATSSQNDDSSATGDSKAEEETRISDGQSGLGLLSVPGLNGQGV